VAPINRILVTGGAGYVGSVLVPKLLNAGYQVTVLDLFLYGEQVFDQIKDHPGLRKVRGDIRDRAVLERVTPGCDAVIHLACISNDPSFELNPELGKSINYDAFFGLVDVSKESGVRRFVYASSSSVYGIKDEENVTEDLALLPLTDYSKYKAMCEDVLMDKQEVGFTSLILRPATVCGYSPRLRLDLSVNILTNHAINKRGITVFGGQQVRPNIHIEDMTDLYVKTMEYPDAAIDGKIYNAGTDNKKIIDIATLTKNIVGQDVEIVTTETNDNRSYHISSEKISSELGFIPKRSVDDAVVDLVAAFGSGKIPQPLTDIRYYNIQTMQTAQLK